MPATGGRLGTKLPPPAATTTTGAMISVPASVVSFQRPSASFSSARRHLAEMELRIERLDLFHQPVGQFLAGDDGQAGNVVDRLFGIKLGALAARPVEDVDQMALRSSSPSSNTAKSPMGPAPIMATSVSMGGVMLYSTSLKCMNL